MPINETPPARSIIPGMAPVEITLAEQTRMVQALADSFVREAGAGAGPAPRHVETHISHVLLHAGHAFKFKKAIATSFLDQSTLARRRDACAEELRLNRRLAPDLYLDTVEVIGMPDAPRLVSAAARGELARNEPGETREARGGAPVLDVAVRMRQFDENALWDRLALRGELGRADIDDLAGRLARFHAEAAVAPGDDPGSPYGQPAQVRQVLLDSLADLQAHAPRAGWPDAEALAGLARLREWEADAFARTRPAMARRLASGRVREGHGDLHLGNVAREGGRCLVFDGIEFNAAFRWLDVMDEVAFMAMDLHAHGLPSLAHRFVNAYLEASGDYDGLRVIGYYHVHRALVRAKVAQLRIEQAAEGERAAAVALAARYFALALRLAEGAAGGRRRPMFLITHGLSGSGKTTLTQGLVEAAGAVRVRADVERKRLAGLAAHQPSGSSPCTGLYTAAMNEATQARLLAAAGDVVEAGFTVIVDATFIRRGARDEARRCVARLGVPFVVLRFEAPAEVLRERVRARLARGDDASEADEAVLAAQQLALEPLQADELPETFEVRPRATGRDGASDVDWAALLARL